MCLEEEGRVWHSLYSFLQKNCLLLDLIISVERVIQSRSCVCESVLLIENVGES